MKRLVRDCPSVDNILDSRKEVLLQFWGLGGRLNLLTIYKNLGKYDEMLYRTSELSGCCERGFESLVSVNGRERESMDLNELLFLCSWAGHW
jgi:hypothetical protein